MEWNKKLNKNINEIQKNLDGSFSTVNFSSNIPVSIPVRSSNSSVIQSQPFSKLPYRMPSPPVSLHSENFMV
jgi:hypothetical protein